MNAQATLFPQAAHGCAVCCSRCQGPATANARTNTFSISPDKQIYRLAGWDSDQVTPCSEPSALLYMCFNDNTICGARNFECADNSLYPWTGENTLVIRYTNEPRALSWGSGAPQSQRVDLRFCNPYYSIWSPHLPCNCFAHHRHEADIVR